MRDPYAATEVTEPYSNHSQPDGWTDERASAWRRWTSLCLHRGCKDPGKYPWSSHRVEASRWLGRSGKSPNQRLGQKCWLDCHKYLHPQMQKGLEIPNPCALIKVHTHSLFQDPLRKCCPMLGCNVSLGSPGLKLPFPGWEQWSPRATRESVQCTPCGPTLLSGSSTKLRRQPIQRLISQYVGAPWEAPSGAYRRMPTSATY